MVLRRRTAYDALLVGEITVEEYVGQLRHAAKRVLEDYQAGRDPIPGLNDLEDTAGFRQQEGT